MMMRMTYFTLSDDDDDNDDYFTLPDDKNDYFTLPDDDDDDCILRCLMIMMMMTYFTLPDDGCLKAAETCRHKVYNKAIKRSL